MPNYGGNVATLTKWQPKWQSGATQTIRVPIVLADRILDLAHRLDQGEDIEAKPDVETLSQVIEKLEQVYLSPRNNFGKERKALLREAIEQLKSL